MNKLLSAGMMLLGGFAVVAAAEPGINFTGFEEIAAGTADLASCDEAGERGAQGYFAFTATNGVTDASQVKASGEPFAFAAACGVPDAFKNRASTNYLDLATCGGILWRSLYGAASSGETGDAYSLATTVYCDTMVQFTPFVNIKTPPADLTRDKFVLWLNVTEKADAAPVTNLCLYAGRISAANGQTTPTLFVFTNAPAVSPRTWYRLTVEAIPNISGFDGDETKPGDNLSAFRFHLDGHVLRSRTAGLTSLPRSVLKANNSPYLADAAANALFGSLASCTNGARTAFTALGFSGTGAVDDLQLSEDAPAFLTEGLDLDFTLALGDGVASVLYALGGNEPVELTARSTNFAVTAGSVVTVRDPVVQDWYAVDEATLGSRTISTSQVWTVGAKLAASPIGGIAAETVRNWATGRGFSYADVLGCPYRAESYLFNTPTLLATRPKLAITAIAAVDGGWELTVEASADDATLSLANLNGALKLATASTLEGLDAAAAVALVRNVDFTTDTHGRAVVRVAGDNTQFMKASVGLVTEGAE